jgi:hypothetical protein
MGLNGIATASFPTTRVDIEQWMSEAVTLPEGCRQTATAFARIAGPMGRLKGMKPLTDAVEGMKGAPLSSKITMTVVPAPGSNRPSRGPITTTTDVIAIREQPLSDQLFAVPSGYKKVERATPSATLPKQVSFHGH